MLKKITVGTALLLSAALLLIPALYAQDDTPTCDTAASTAAELLDGAAMLLEVENLSGAQTLIEAARDELRACAPDDAEATSNAIPSALEPTVTAAAATTTSVPAATATPAAPTATPSPTPETTPEATPESAAAPTNDNTAFTLNSPSLPDDVDTVSFVRFAHVSIDIGAIDLYFSDEDTPVVQNLRYGAVTELVSVPAGNRTFTAYPAGSDRTGDPLYQLSWDFASSTSWIVTATGLQETFSFILEPISIVRNNYQGNARVRIVNLIAGAPNVSVQTQSGQSLGAGLRYIGLDDTLLTPGDYVLTAETDTGTVLPQPRNISLEANQTYTYYVMGRGDDEFPLRLLEIVTPINSTLVKFIGATSDPVDIHYRPTDARIVQNLLPDTETDWITLPSRAVTFISYAPGTGPTGTELAALAWQLRPGREVIVRVGDNSMQVQAERIGRNAP